MFIPQVYTGGISGNAAAYNTIKHSTTLLLYITIIHYYYTLLLKAFIPLQ